MKQPVLFNKKLSGFTMIEMIISILIISIAVLGTLIAIRTSTRYSASPMILHQGIAIAESYLDEISSKSFVASPCPSAPASRANFSTVCDYQGYTSGVPIDQTGTAVTGLGNYTVSVNIDNAAANLNGVTGGANVVRIDVTVSQSHMPTMTFSAYRTNYTN